MQTPPASNGAAEPLKKMPKGTEDNSGGNQTIAPAAPNLTPTGARIESDSKNPF